MTREQAKANQDRISKQYTLAFWYGTWCDKCCGVYPKFMTTNTLNEECWYECEVCGRKTNTFQMPHEAREAWNSKQWQGTYHQMSFSLR